MVATFYRPRKRGWNERDDPTILQTGAEMNAASPFLNLASTPPVGFEEAIRAAASHRPCSGGLAAETAAALSFGHYMVRRGKNCGLSVDQVASINLYTQDGPFYSALNGALGGWGADGGRSASGHYMPYCKLTFGALKLLPKVATTVYRGIHGVALNTLLQGKTVNDMLTWWAFTSTTGTPDVLRDEAFLGDINSASTHRIAFVITIKSGVRIKGFSEFGNNLDDYMQPIGVCAQDEDEILLLPGTTFKITSIKVCDGGVTEVQMIEVGSALVQESLAGNNVTAVVTQGQGNSPITQPVGSSEVVAAAAGHEPIGMDGHQDGHAEQVQIAVTEGAGYSLAAGSYA